MKQFFTKMLSLVGEIIITSNGQEINGVYFPEHKFYTQACQYEYKPEIFKQAIIQFNEYFLGQRFSFNLPISFTGTEFQKKVWLALSNISYGKTKSYKEIAAEINAVNSSRAVGMANGKNPLSIIIPCHRVINSNNKLSGYAGGVKAKKWLLDHEAKYFKSS